MREGLSSYRGRLQERRQRSDLDDVQRVFLQAMAERDVPVVILEGQVNPAAETPRLDAARPRIRAVLAALGRDDPNVSFVPAEELPNFTDADFTDFAHLTPGAGAAFADDLVSRILPAAIAKHRPLTP